jgi:predicted HTH domain antitoxin
VTDLEILSGLRKLQSVTKKQVQKMPIVYDLKKDIRFKEGIEEGEERAKRLSAIRMLKQGTLSIVTIAEYLDVPLAFVVQIQEELQKKKI